MIEHGQGGAIVLTSSTGGLIGAPSDVPGMLGYTAAKHGVIGLMRSWANFLAPHNIRVNSVARWMWPTRSRGSPPTRPATSPAPWCPWTRATSTGAEPCTGPNWGRAWRRASESIDQPTLRVYDCRNAAATTWLRAGNPRRPCDRFFGTLSLEDRM